MLELTFITSSSIKLNHAIHLCKDYAVNIISHKRKYYGKGYEEPRIYDRNELLKRSIEDAFERWKKNISRPNEKFFFIEDTSVIIHALSQQGREVPGVDIKYWMQEKDFNSLDQMLKQNHNDRRATVRSDVVLMLTSSLRKEREEPFIRFTSEINGVIVDHEYDIETNPVYPWLDNKTFNKWFIPDGSTLPISMLNIVEADKYDFRAGAFREMLSFLIKNNQIPFKVEKNFPELMTQGELFQRPPLFIVSGPTCAGKTTLAECITKNFVYYHIEASDFMYLNYYNKLGTKSTTTISEFARQALMQEPDIVVKEILKFIDSLKEEPIIVTGLRTLTEINFFIDKYKGLNSIEIIIVDADERIRLQRYLARNRGGSATEDKFYNETNIQNEMGLSSVIKFYPKNIIFNNASVDEYYHNFLKKYDNKLLCKKSNEPQALKPTALEDAILISLFKNNNHYLTTTEIAKLINQQFSDMNIIKNKNNVSRYFNQRFYPYFEVIFDNNVNKYRLSQTGRMHAQWLLQKK